MGLTQVEALVVAGADAGYQLLVEKLVHFAAVLLELGCLLNALVSRLQKTLGQPNFGVVAPHLRQFSFGHRSVGNHVQLEQLQLASVFKHHLPLRLSLVQFVRLDTLLELGDLRHYVNTVIDHAHKGAREAPPEFLILNPAEEVFAAEHNFLELFKFYLGFGCRRFL